MTILQMGVAKQKITPPFSVPLAGFSSRSGAFEGISQDLYLRIVVMNTQNARAEVTTVLIVSADLIWWGSDRIAAIRSTIKSRWGLEEASILLHATHTHSGPQTSSLFTPSLGAPDEKYIDFLEHTLYGGIAAAYDNLEPVTIEYGKGACEIAINRRKQVDGNVRMMPNEEGVVDRELQIVRYVKKDGTPKALFVHYGCHPTTTNENRVSSEFVGVAMSMLEELIGNDVTSLFLQGCCGDVRPSMIKEGQFYRGDDHDVQRLGLQLTEKIEDILQGPMSRIAPGEISAYSAIVHLPFEKLEASVPLELQLIRLSNHLVVLSMNGEVVTEYGLYIKKSFGGNILPLGYSNGMLGYIPTAAQLREGGYEANESHYFFGLPAPFSSEVEQKIKKGIDELIHKSMERGKEGYSS